MFPDYCLNDFSLLMHIAYFWSLVIVCELYWRAMIVFLVFNTLYVFKHLFFSKQAVREAATICTRPLQFDLWSFDLENGVLVTCDGPTSVPILVFIGLSVLDLGPMCATDRRQTDVRRASSLNATYRMGGGITSSPKSLNKYIVT